MRRIVSIIGLCTLLLGGYLYLQADDDVDDVYYWHKRVPSDTLKTATAQPTSPLKRDTIRTGSQPHAATSRKPVSIRFIQEQDTVVKAVIKRNK